MNIPTNLKYTNDHEWIRVEGNVGFIGVTEYAQGELGDVVFLDVASDLDAVQQGESFGTIEAVKTVSDLYSPVDGKVLEVNSKLEAEPQLINSDPYGEGWIIKVELNDLSQIDSLMDADAYKAHIGQ